MLNKKCTVLEIAEFIFSITNHSPIGKIRFDKSYQGFLCSNRRFDVSIQAYYDQIPQITFHKKDLIFNSGTVWSLYRLGKRRAFVMGSPVRKFQAYRLGIFDSDFKEGNIYIKGPIPLDNSFNSQILYNPLEYPLSELLMINLLSLSQGLMFHACGVVDNGHGYLFVGNSGDGKSTIAKLWQGQASILNDDRIIVRKNNGRFYMYGTPWHGRFNLVLSKKAILKKIFFIKHGKENIATRKIGRETSTMLLARSFPPYWNHRGMMCSLKFIEELSKAIPCYELMFIPDRNILRFIKKLKY